MRSATQKEVQMHRWLSLSIFLSLCAAALCSGATIQNTAADYYSRFAKVVLTNDTKAAARLRRRYLAPGYRWSVARGAGHLDASISDRTAGRPARRTSDYKINGITIDGERATVYATL